MRLRDESKSSDPPSNRRRTLCRFLPHHGFHPIVSHLPSYARFECPDGGATFSLHQIDSVTPDSGVVVYFECADLDATCSQLLERGIQFDSPPTDQRWLWREARLRDPDGNVICLFHAGENRRNPPWRLR